jgi:hypothetical protein
MTERRSTRRAVRLLTATAALALVAVPATGAEAANTVEGRCTLRGELTFDPPLANQPAFVRYRDHSTGTCTGTLNGVPHTDAPVVLRGEGAGTLGCLFGRTLTRGTVTFTQGTRKRQDDVSIAYWAESTGGLTQFVSRSHGAISGEGIGYFNFLPYGDENTLAACEAGTLTSAGYEAVTQTLTPNVG